MGYPDTLALWRIMKAQTETLSKRATHAKPVGKRTTKAKAQAKPAVKRAAKPKRPSKEFLSEADIGDITAAVRSHWFHSRKYREEAEDLAQVVALHVWLMQGSYTGKNGASVRTFCYGVGRNRALAEIRKIRRRQELSDDNEDTIAERVHRKSASGFDSGCYRKVGDKRLPIYRA